jgi:hypothetical protein
MGRLRYSICHHSSVSESTHVLKNSFTRDMQAQPDSLLPAAVARVPPSSIRHARGQARPAFCTHPLSPQGWRRSTCCPKGGAWHIEAEPSPGVPICCSHRAQDLPKHRRPLHETLWILESKCGLPAELQSRVLVIAVSVTSEKILSTAQNSAMIGVGAKSAMFRKQ